jgi:hypothetical protein
VAVVVAGDVAIVAAGFPNNEEDELGAVAGVTTTAGIAGCAKLVCDEAAGCVETCWVERGAPKRVEAGLALLNKLAAGA